MLIISALKRLREKDTCKVKTRLVYRMRLRSPKKKQQKAQQNVDRISDKGYRIQ